MRKTIKGLISIVLVLSMLLSTSMVVFAAKKEVYLSDLRLVYAKSYDEAQQVLVSSKLEGYQILNENLNAGTGKNGVWLAYKTTTNIDDAITDISVMQMGGGYSEGNYKQMLQQSKDEYIAMGNIYLDAIAYFAEAYEADHFLTLSAYRQLNVYAGLDNYKNDRLGSLIVNEELTVTELATMFMQGNSYVLKNIRSLLAMGVSYNEEGLTYLQRVSLLASGTYGGELDESLDGITADDIVLSDSEDADVLAALIAPSITVFRKMFEELSAYEDEMNYADETFTDLELKYAEYKAIAEMMRDVNYLGGQSLYDFCLNYTMDTRDYSDLYPLAQALNDGQIAMTKVMHYYDVVRYSVSGAPENVINDQLTELEAKYAEKPFDVYTGVDRSIFNGTFALTSAAYRADAYTDSYSLSEALFGKGAWLGTTAQIVTGAAGAGLFIWAIVRSVKGSSSAAEPVVEAALESLEDVAQRTAENVGKQMATNYAGTQSDALVWIHNQLVSDGYSNMTKAAFKELSFEGKINFLASKDVDLLGHYYDNDKVLNTFDEAFEQYNQAYRNVMTSANDQAQSATTTAVSNWSGFFTGALYVIGALSIAYSAISLYKKVYDYYHPEYDEIPEAMVDLIKTVDGDRYIKYDVVLEAQMKDGEYHPADLNAFEAQRWNALYYTKSYEAGKPLLASFALSNSNNRAAEDYLPVHRFGEVVCYDLNKYNFNSASYVLFLSVAQSENQKSAVADVPDIVGSIFGAGIWFIAGTLGAALGIGGTIGTQFLLNKKKKDGETDPSDAE